MDGTLGTGLTIQPLPLTNNVENPSWENQRARPGERAQVPPTAMLKTPQPATKRQTTTDAQFTQHLTRQRWLQLQPLSKTTAI